MSAATPLLLQYATSSNPEPLVASTVLTPATGTIDIAVTDGAVTAYADKITLSVQVGSDAGSVFAQTPKSKVDPTSWSVHAAVVRGESIGLPGANYARFTFAPLAADYVIPAGLVFTLTGEMAVGFGEVGIIVHEQAGTVNDPTTFTDNEGSLTLQIVSPQLYLRNLALSTPAAPTVPVTELTRSGCLGARLSWESNGTFFEIYEKANPNPIYSDTKTSYDLKDEYQTDTTFFLKATKPRDGGDSDTLYETLTLTITDPALTPSSVVASGDVTVGGAVTVTGALDVTGTTTLRDGASVAGTLDVNGPTTLAAAAPARTLDAKGATALEDAIVSGHLAVHGPTILRSLDVGTGGLAVGGEFSANVSPFSAMSPSKLQLAHDVIYTARTDGFAIATLLCVDVPEDGPDVACWMGGSSWMADDVAVASEVIATNAVHSASITIPVAAGWNFEFLLITDSPQYFQCKIHWMSLGGMGIDGGDPVVHA
jgi:hypothetical protein